YEFLAKYADRIKVMAYELHPRKYRNPGPGPQAPNAWIASIIEYAKTRVPSYKLYMAIPTYGYDWALNCRAPAKAVYFSDANRIRSMHGAEYQPTNMSKIYSENKKSRSWTNLTKFMYIHENKVYEDPSIWYNSNGCDRVAFYMNKKAFEDKMNLLRKYKIGGFSFWQLLSDNDPGINDYLELLVNNKLPAVKTIDEEIAENRLKQEISANKAAESNKSSETPEKVNSVTDDKESRNTGRN
ncbi:MAG: hydrolase, partial [Leptospira sp.]|nr:hydrolase [Leptospira sp.]